MQVKEMCASYGKVFREDRFVDIISLGEGVYQIPRKKSGKIKTIFTDGKIEETDGSSTINDESSLAKEVEYEKAIQEHVKHNCPLCKQETSGGVICKECEVSLIIQGKTVNQALKERGLEETEIDLDEMLRGLTSQIGDVFVEETSPPTKKVSRTTKRPAQTVIKASIKGGKVKLSGWSQIKKDLEVD